MDRQTIERKIVSKLVTDILKAGYRIGVSLERGYDIDDLLMGSTDKNKIVDAAFAASITEFSASELTRPSNDLL